MGFFAFMYYQSFIAVYKASVGGVIEMAITGLSAEEQAEVVRGLAKHLVNQGVVGGRVTEWLGENLVVGGAGAGAAAAAAGAVGGG